MEMSGWERKGLIAPFDRQRYARAKADHHLDHKVDEQGHAE